MKNECGSFFCSRNQQFICTINSREFNTNVIFMQLVRSRTRCFQIHNSLIWFLGNGVHFEENMHDQTELFYQTHCVHSILSLNINVKKNIFPYIGVPSVPVILAMASYISIVIVIDFRAGIFLSMNDTVTVTAPAFLPSSTIHHSRTL